MDLVLLIARLALAAVFVVAGVAKLLDRPGSRQAAVDFGVPARFAPAVAILLPIAEIAVAVALIPNATARWGALGALALLALFIAGIAVSMSQGRAPDCHCFGQLHSEPAGWPTIARNGALAAVAAFVVFAGWGDPGYSPVAWLGDLSGAETVLLVGGLVLLGAVAALGWATVGLMDQNGRLLLRLEAIEQSLATGAAAPTRAQSAPLGLPAGTPAPAFSLPDLDGNTVSLDTLRAENTPVMLIFSDPGCGPCNQMMPEVARWQRDLAGQLNIAILSRGSREANLAKAREHGLTRVLLQEDRELAKAYGSTGTPAAVLVRPDGAIAAPLAGGAEAVRALAASATGAIARTNGAATAPGEPALQIGEAVPEMQLPTLDGMPVELAGTRERDSVLLFWNPGCGFCQRMLGDILAWEAARPDGSPDLVVISAGADEPTRANGFQSTVLLDHGVGVGRRFGARGTPAAVRIDEAGRVVSPVATGAVAAMALLRGGTTAPSATGVVPPNGRQPVPDPSSTN